MTEAQYITLILGFVSTVTAVLIALLINNARLNDAKEALRAESRADGATVRSEMSSLRSEMASMREAILTQMATYQMDIISKIAGLDNRITRLEK